MYIYIYIYIYIYFGKYFLNLLDKHFPPPHHKFHRLFSISKIKISYICIPNLKSFINKPNKTPITET